MAVAGSKDSSDVALGEEGGSYVLTVTAVTFWGFAASCHPTLLRNPVAASLAGGAGV